MTELLSREKEFLKLNEQLNKLTTITMEQHQLQQQQQLQQHANNISTQQQQQQQQSKGDQKFFTYTKTTSKGAKIEMRKRGAGDGVVENVGDNQGSLKERSNNNNNNSSNNNNNTNCSNNSTNNNNNNSVANSSINSNTFRTGRFRQQHHSTAPTTTTTMTATANATPTPDDCPTQMTSPSPPTEGRREATATITTTTLNSIAAAASHRIRQIAKTQDSQVSRTFSRSSTSRMPTAPTTATFTVKYRNPKFVESPSLEVLVKDESASIRPRPLASPSSRLASDADSTASVTTLGPGSVSRRSQMGGRKQISTDGLIKFLKSKIAILEEDHDRISQEMTQQKELLEKTLDRQKKVEQQRDQAYSKHNAISEQLTKVESQLEDATRRIKERLMDQSAQQKDLEQVKREVKVLTQTNTNLEKRLYRANEELENTKNALTMMKAAERELRETMRVESEGKDKQIKSLKKQRADLLNAYKKQLFLIDNLKRQNTCMEQSKMIGFAEKEFTKVLEWNTKT